jgi:hypothetical protein
MNKKRKKRMEKKRIENTSSTSDKYSQNGIVNTNYNIFVFKSNLFKDQSLRIVNNADKKPYFASSDIAKVLLYKNLDSMAKILVKDNDKFQYKDAKFYNSALGFGIQPNAIFINLQGVNDVLLRTKSKNAKSLKKWLFSEILPCFEEFYAEDESIEEDGEGSEETKECDGEGVEETKESDGEGAEETKQSNKVFKLKLSNNVISDIDVREDGYINITQLCKAGGKSFVEYNKVKQNQGYLEAISSFLRIPNAELIDIKLSGTYAHPKVACHLAKWISSDFEEQVLDFIERKNESPHIPEFRDFKLVLSDGKEFSIPVRKDGYVNATLLCKASGKRIDNWMRLDSTKNLFSEFSNSLRSEGVKSTDCLEGKYGGTFIHPDLAVQLAQWISPSFSLQVSRWIRELLLTGKVELGKEKSNEELENVYKEKLAEMGNQLENAKNEFKVLSKTHNSMLKRQKRTPYEIGSVVYVLSHEAFTGFYKTDYFKVGEATQKSGEDHSAFVKRLSGYNTSAPVNFKVNFLIYVEENQLLEQNILTGFRKNLNPCNKEWIKSVDFKTLTDYIITMCNMLNIDYKIVVNDPVVQNTVESCNQVEEINDNEVEENSDEERKKINGKYECATCHEFNISEKKATNCVSCARLLSRKVKERPSLEQLLDDVGRMNIVDIGKKYGVSDNCIRKWIRNG